MKTSLIDHTGNPLCVHPMPKHDFVGNGNQFECSVCDLPRAMHLSKEQPVIPSNIDPRTPPIRSISFSMAMRGELLTDKKISEYEKRGCYSLEFQQARRGLWAKRSANRTEGRKSNFETMDGRLIYRP